MNKAKILSIIAFAQGVTIIVLCICLDLQRRANEFSVRQLNEMLAMQPTGDYEEGFSDGAEFVFRLIGDDSIAGYSDKILKLKKLISETSPKNLRLYIQAARSVVSTNHESK